MNPFTAWLRSMQADQAKLAEVRRIVDGYLDAYGASQFGVFKVSNDLANSIRKVLDGRAS